RILRGKRIKLRFSRTLLLSIQRQVERLGQELLRWQRVCPLECQHARQHSGAARFLTRLRVVLDDGEELFFAPSRDRLSVLEQARRLDGEEPRGVVDRFFVRAPCESFIGRQVQLAGCVVAAVALGTAPFEDRLHIPPVVNGCEAGRTRRRRGRLAYAHRCRLRASGQGEQQQAPAPHALRDRKRRMSNHEHSTTIHTLYTLGRRRSKARERPSRSYCSPPLKSVTALPFVS